MMKRAIQAVLIVAMVFVTTSASAQFGVKLGYVATQNLIKGGNVNESGMQVGVLAGINYDVPLTGGLSMRPGVNYIYVGANVEDERERDHTLAIPIDLKWAFDLGYEKSLYVTAGPKANIGLLFENNIYGDVYKGGMYNRFDLQLGLGMGMQTGPLLLELGFDMGLMNRINKEFLNGADASLSRNQLVLSVGYHF
jgi:hypothetical protein